MSFPRATAVLIGLLFMNLAPVAAQPAAEEVASNDNRRPAGTLANSVLNVRIRAARGDWRPEAGNGPALRVAAFGEEGGPLLTPGPLLRVAEGTTIQVRITNTLSERLSVHGLKTRSSAQDAGVAIEPGQSRDIRFVAGKPGTYHYWATSGSSTLSVRKAAESQLGGAFIIDPRGDVPADRVFVITEWDDSSIRPDTGRSAFDRVVFAINGRSWPHTERLDERVGRPVGWHIVNLSQDEHPMHLHGFYFSVRGSGDGAEYVAYAPEDHRTVVTEVMAIGRTLQMAWTPERPGNWLFHCHNRGHVTPQRRFWKLPLPSDDHSSHAEHDPAASMAGLIIGIRVAGEGGAPATAPANVAVRRLALSMLRTPGYWQPEDAYGFALETEGRTSTPDDISVPGPLLVLTRGEPVEITLKNHLPVATAVHWHGIELDSYYDGVPGWTGTATNTTPAINPNGAFVVRFTPPRAGTFIYHTHSHDGQLAAGLYGALVVVEPGERFDPAVDHVVVLGSEGPKDAQKYDRFPVVVNGSRSAAVTLKAGVPNRLRFINITTSWSGLNVSLLAGPQPIEWRPIAKDGATLPSNQQTRRQAFRQPVSVGETYDFVFVPPASLTRSWLELRRSTGEWVQQVPIRVVQ